MRPTTIRFLSSTGTGSRESVVLFRSGNPDFGRDIGEPTLAIVLIEAHGLTRQATRAADYGQALPLTLRFVAWLGSGLQIEIQVVHDKQIEISVAVVVNEGTARAPARAAAPQAALAGFVAESALRIAP